MTTFDTRFHKAFQNAREAMADIERLKAAHPSPHWANLRFEVRPAPAMSVWVVVEALDPEAYAFAAEELAVRGYHVPFRVYA